MRKQPRKTEEEKIRDETFLCLYMRHATHDEIAKACGLSKSAVEQRIHRGGLRKKRKEFELATLPKITIEERSEMTKGVLAAAVQKSAENLGEIKHTANVETEKARADLLASLTQSAKTVFDWNGASSGPASTVFNTFNFTARTVGSIEPVTGVPSSVNGATVIDITPQMEDGNGS